MKISELSSGQGNVNVEGTIKEIAEPRVFNKFGRELRVANAILEDDSGSIKLTLWNQDANRFKEGDRVRIVNGYVNEFQGENQLTSGKFGKIEMAGEGADEGGEAEESEEMEDGGEESEESDEEEFDEEDSDSDEDSEEEFEEESEEETEDY